MKAKLLPCSSLIGAALASLLITAPCLAIDPETKRGSVQSATPAILLANQVKNGAKPAAPKSPAAGSRRTNRPTTGNTRADFKTVERNVIEMVHRHLPELEALLEQLKKKEPKQYEAAVRNLAKSQRRLQIAEKRGSQMFELEVRLVQTQTSINLLIAKLKVRDKEADRNALRAATKTLAELQLNKSQLELAQMKSRLAKLQETVNNAETRVEQQESALKQGLESSYQTYLRKAGRK